MILVTGGYGCIGAELVKWLLRNTDDEVLLGSRRVASTRTERAFHDVDRERLTCIGLDVSDERRLHELFAEHQISHVAHLAALQTPDCNAHRDLGLQINLGGSRLEVIPQMFKGLDHGPQFSLDLVLFDGFTADPDFGDNFFFGVYLFSERQQLFQPNQGDEGQRKEPQRQRSRCHVKDNHILFVMRVDDVLKSQ